VEIAKKATGLRRTTRSLTIMYSAFMQYNEVFVTGGTGLLGRYVCRALIGHGFLPRLLETGLLPS
jgi:FlaA1/EpsC-like NDP-sugar epimerase